MALTVAINSRNVAGNRRIHSGTIAFDSSYPTGGEAFTEADMGFGHEITNVQITPTAGYVFEYDYTNSKVIAYRTATVTPTGTNSQPSFTVAASGAIGTNMEVGLSVDTAGATFEGGVGITAARTLTTTSPVGTPTFTGAATTAAALAEVGNTTNLSTLTGVRWHAIGN